MSAHVSGDPGLEGSQPCPHIPSSHPGSIMLPAAGSTAADTGVPSRKRTQPRPNTGAATGHSQQARPLPSLPDRRLAAWLPLAGRQLPAAPSAPGPRPAWRVSATRVSSRGQRINTGPREGAREGPEMAPSGPLLQLPGSCFLFFIPDPSSGALQVTVRQSERKRDSATPR